MCIHDKKKNACIFWLCSVEILFMIFKIFWNWCSHGPWRITQENSLAQDVINSIMFEWSWLVENNCTRRTSYFDFDKKTIDLVCDWSFMRCTVSSRHHEPSKGIERGSIKSLWLWAITSREQRTEKIRRKKKHFIIFLLSCFYSYSVHCNQV